MFIRNGIMSNLRERGRTALFSLLIMVLTVTMILALGVLLYCNAVLKECDGAYRSIALIEYMGSEYPKEDEPDEAARKAAKELTDENILNVNGVTGWTRGNTSFAFADGYARRVGNLPYGNRSVIIVGSFSDPLYQWTDFDENGDPIITDMSVVYRTALLKTAIYSRKDREGILIDILPGTSGFVPEKGKNYVLHGSFVDTSGVARTIGEYPMNGYAVFRIDSFIDSDELPYAFYSDEEEIPDRFLTSAEQYRAMNNYVSVVHCKNMEDVYAFQQNDVKLSEGTIPDPKQKNACVISADLAQGLGLKPGDDLVLNKMKGTDSDCYDLSLTGETYTFKVSGITEASSDHTGTVWAVIDDAETPLFGYLLGTVSLRNKDAVEAVEKLQDMAPKQVRVTLFDQGYSNAVQPFQEVRKTAVNVFIICLAGIVAVLMLFAFLFVGRQGETVKIMISLGTPGRKITLWFLSGALLISGVSALFGTLAGVLLRPFMFERISRIIENIRSKNGFLWYSENYVGIAKEVSFEPVVPFWPFICVFAGIVAVSLLFCYFFLKLQRLMKTPQRGKSRVHVPKGGTSVHFRGGLRYSVLSIRRGGLKSIIVPAVSMILTTMVVFLSGMYQGWQNELKNALENTSIEGNVVSINGRYYSDLGLHLNTVKSLLNVGGVDDVAVSYGYNYWRSEEMPRFSSSDYGKERRLNWIKIQPGLVALNSMKAAKEFYYSDPGLIWLEGWDEEVFNKQVFTPLLLRRGEEASDDPIPGVFSKSFLEERGLSLGDTISCFVLTDREIEVAVKAVGSYVQQGSKANIYIPLSCHIPAELLTGDEPAGDYNNVQRVRMEQTITFSTCRFNISSAGELDNVRDSLRAEGFSAVGHMGRNRTTVVLKDSAFLKLKENMERNITMGRVMSTMILILVILLGFIISWMMIFTRRREFALMRGFGAKKGRVFSSFFLEQAILNFMGCLLGCVSLLWLYTGGTIQLLAVLAFMICYLIGAAVSILFVGKIDLMELLTVRE